ncbi:MAG: hypothetical protein H8E63_00325 [Proteobacteria bacterium]|nr:hypothetical protein [Pseudomonadota bacterium]
MKFSSHIIVAVALVFSLSGYGCDSQSSGAEEVVEACEAVCDRLDECGTDLRLFVPGTTDLGEESDCFATCDDLDDLEPEISQSCKDAITTVFECTDSLECNVVEDFDFTRQRRLLATNFDLFGGALLSLLTSVPPVLEGSAFTCNLARSDRNYDYCPVNSDCIRFPFVFGGTNWQECSVSGFDMITMLVEDCETEYIAMAEECRGEPRFY